MIFAEGVKLKYGLVWDILNSPTNKLVLVDNAIILPPVVEHLHTVLDCVNDFTVQLLVDMYIDSFRIKQLGTFRTVGHI